MKILLKKLFHLLKKDALLTWRSKVWTVFEILLPLFLIIAPAVMLKMLMAQVTSQMAALSDLPEFEKDIYSPYIYVDGCGIGAARVRNYLADSEVTWVKSFKKPRGGDMFAGDRWNRKKMIKRVRVNKCGNHTDVTYVMEADMSSTLIIPLVGRDTKKSYMFLGYQYMMNKIFFAMIHRLLLHTTSVFSNPLQKPSAGSLQKTLVPNFDNHLYTLPRLEFPPISSILIMAFPYIYAICVTLPVISLTRTVLVEKETVTPYLHSIGLPVWLFYVEHFLFGVFKSTVFITSLSLIWVFMIKNFPGVVILGIFAYTLNSVSFSLFVSTLFPSSKRAVEGMVLLWIGSLALSSLYPSEGSLAWITSLNPNHAFSSFITAVTYRAGAQGMSFSDMFDTRSTTHQCAAVYLGYMFFNTIWMLVAAIFIERILKKLGNAILKTFWNGWRKIRTSKSKKSSKKSQNPEDLARETILNCRESPEGRDALPADIQLEGLVKVYPNGEKAVNGLSLIAVRGQVSVLLGHNGCGKSTTFGMITGMVQASSGKVTISGIDASTNKKHSETRSSLGYCPQYNPLYDKLTVMEHLELVNALKGAPGNTLRIDAEDLMEQINFMDKKDELAKNLSGGMKRKLCVLMAMIGGSKVILLDEPTAGMDPGARQDVQKMLTQSKSDKTILLTTHYMNEAERMGDWIFVMAHGRMAASGSIHFLKHQFGEGMLMTLVYKDGPGLKEMYQIGEDVCKNFIGSARIKDMRGQMCEISLPESDKQKLPSLLKCLEAVGEKNFWSASLEPLPRDLRGAVQKLELITIGISMSSLEQVFIRIGDQCDKIISGVGPEERKEAQKKLFEVMLILKEQPTRKGILRILMKIVALLEKRVYYFYRNLTTVILQILLPMAVLWYFGIMFFNVKEDPTIRSQIEIESLDLSAYPRSTIILQREDKNESRLLEYLETFPNLYMIEEDYGLNITELVTKYSAGLQKLGFVLKLSKSLQCDAFYNDDDPKNAAILMNLLAVCMYLRLPEKIRVAQDLPHISSKVIWVLTKDRAGNVSVMNLLTWMILFTTILAGVVIQSVNFLCEERLCKFVHQQTLTGLSSFLYWTMAFIWDLLIFSLIVGYTMAFVMEYKAFEAYEYEILLLLYCVLLSLAPITYIISTWVGSPTKGSFLLYLYCIIPYFGFLISFYVLSAIKKDEWKMWAQLAFRILNPTTAFILGVLKIATLIFDSASMSVVFRLKKAWGMDMDGLIIEIAFLLGFALLFSLFLCIKSLKSVRQCCFYCFNCSPKIRAPPRFNCLEPCQAVEDERKLVPTVDKKEKVVVVENITKNFGKTRAVNALHLAISHEECFGLLGANGAGKTTAFDIITGLRKPNCGKVYIEGKSIRKRLVVGYCPQFDAMMQQISGRQTLRIMARLQGYKNVGYIVETVLECIGMKDHGNKLVKNCSGGQRRKLSVGIALLSTAKCIILDEPTSGIDPRARRELWDILHAIRIHSKSSILLTSHSMEECEALCTRIGVLRQGDLVALGTSQALKSQYGHTFSMTFVLFGLVDRQAVCAKVKEEMPEAVLKTPETTITTNLVWELPRVKTDLWSDKFSKVEVLAAKAQVRDYMLTQSTLEDTFIRLNTAK